MTLLLFCFGCLTAISYGRRTQCVWQPDVCHNLTHALPGIQPIPNSMWCDCEGYTLSCVQSYQTEHCDQTDPDLINAFDQAQSPCCVSQPSPPPSDFPGCCVGTTSKCDTEDKLVCDRASTCEWSYDATDCGTEHGVQTQPSPPPTPVAVIGCCSGDAPECNVGNVETRCNRNGPWGCEWIDGPDADCSSSESSSSGSSSSERGSGRGSSGKSSSGKSSGSSSRRSSSSSSDRRGPGSEQSLFADVSVGEKQKMSHMDVMLLCVFAVTLMTAAYQLYRWCSGSEYKALPEMSQSQPLLGTEI